MRKKLISILLVLGMTISLLAGCGGSGSDSESANAGSTESESTESAAASSVTYAYEQELNIIDDNYRNYYEIFVYSFYDSDGDGIGDLNGVTEKLDYIEEMGFNGIWLMPIMPSSSYHKYDVDDYYAIDEAYGTMEDFENLVEECHERGIRIIIDFVINHTSSSHEWFVTACEYLATLEEGEEPDLEECPYVDYYHFSQTQESSTYYLVDDTTSWYYEGAFWSEMPDLNVSNEALMQELKDISAFWIEKGVDGFRMDAALHFDETDYTVNTSTLNEIYTYCLSLNPDFYMVSEVWDSEATIAKYYESETPSMFNFTASSAEGILVKAASGTSSAALLVDKMLDFQETFSAVYADYIDAPFLTNHDQSRVANNLQSNEDNIKMAAGLLMMMSGSPCVYYGEEIVMKSTGTSDENKRVAMQWSSDEDAEGMTDGPADADDFDQTFASVEEQLTDENSIINYYKRALRLRNENPEIARGTIAIVESLTEGTTAAITKTYEDSTIAIVYNTSEEAATVDISGSELSEMEIRGYLTLTTSEEITLEDGVLTMPGKSICILK
ncbi:MAG: alpha amylase [Clostridiales bacterium]|nr:alpha amylase [Clostridiales bacterium]